jgi:hypothetical protein
MRFHDPYRPTAVEQALSENLDRLKAIRTNSHPAAVTRSGSG